MNRAKRRSSHRNAARTALHDVSAQGCRCRPEITALSTVELPVSITVGFDILHEPGCPLGDRVLAVNCQGFVPVMITFPGECDR
jgi:hypothetical protein